MKPGDEKKRNAENMTGRGSGTDREKLFVWLASDYAEEYGRQLNKELAELDTQDLQDRILGRGLSPSAEERILKQVERQYRRKRNRRLKTGFAAACILLLLMVPVSRMLHQTESNHFGEDYIAENEAPDERDFEWIALTTQLPKGFSIVDEEQDQGKSIYYLAEENLDDVVLVLERVGSGGTDQEQLREARIKGHLVYGLSDPDYKVLTFVKDEIQYTLTCQYEMNTLLTLGYNIL